MVYDKSITEEDWAMFSSKLLTGRIFACELPHGPSQLQGNAGTILVMQSLLTEDFFQIDFSTWKKLKELNEMEVLAWMTLKQ